MEIVCAAPESDGGRSRMVTGSAGGGVAASGVRVRSEGQFRLKTRRVVVPPRQISEMVTWS